MSPNDFVVTIHAFERLEERFPELAEGISLRKQAKMIHEEVMDALEAGRHGVVPPLELTSRAANGSLTRTPHSYFVWTKKKDRGYLIKEDPQEGMLVVTVIIGVPHEDARTKIWKPASRERLVRNVKKDSK